MSRFLLKSFRVCEKNIIEKSIDMSPIPTNIRLCKILRIIYNKNNIIYIVDVNLGFVIVLKKELSVKITSS